MQALIDFLTTKTNVMDNLIVCVFNDREKAMDAWDQIGDLETLDDLVIFRETMLQKTERGDLKLVSNVNNTSGWNMVTDMTMGTLVGMLGGPLGMIVGYVAGTAVGTMDELQEMEVSEQFALNLKSRMKNGTCAIILEAYEFDPMILDSYMSRYGAWMNREPIHEVYEQYKRELDAKENEMMAIERRMNMAAAASEKAEIRRELDEAKMMVNEARTRLRDRIDVLARELALKTEKLGEKMRSAKSDLKKKLAMEKDHMERAGRRQNEKLRELLETAV